MARRLARHVFVERLWRSVKYEEVYLKAYETVSAARAGLARDLDFYNMRRPHSSLDGKSPVEFYFAPRGDPEGSPSDETGCRPRRLRSSQANAVRRRGQPCRIASLTRESDLSNPRGLVCL